MARPRDLAGDLTSCYVCERGLRPFESFFVVRRLMDRGGIENRWYGTRFARCQDCPRPRRVLVLDGIGGFGELRKRGS